MARPQREIPHYSLGRELDVEVALQWLAAFYAQRGGVERVLPELVQAIHAVLLRARQGQLRSSDLADSTLTVTQRGDLGSDVVYGVIYPPQVAIVGLGRVVARPVARDGQVLIARTLQARVAADHRVRDGLRSARFLASLQALLRQPAQLA